MRVLRVIVAAMAGGMLSFLAIAVFLVEGGTMTLDPDLAKVLLPVIAFLAVGEVVAYLVLRSATIRKLNEPQPPHVAEHGAPTPMGSLATLTIIGCAMAEGVGLLAIVTYLLSGNHLAWIPVAAALLVLAMQWPTRDWLKHFSPRD
jgi:hypothetical protein